MSRPSRYVFFCLTLALALYPLTLGKPGLPQTLKADETGYYLMALSLARDGDLRCELDDVRRLLEEYPLQPVENLILLTDDGWRTAKFGKPFIYPFLATPFAALFGSNGFVSLNVLLMAGMIWLGARYLVQWNPDWLALLFSAGFFVLSNQFAYVYWIHPEVLNMFALTAALALVMTPGDPGDGTGRWARLRAFLARDPVRAALSGAALAVAGYNKPVLVLPGLAAIWILHRRHGWRGAARWLAGAAAATAILCALSTALVGHPTAYLGAERAGVKVEDFDVLPFEPRSEPLAPLPGELGPRNSWWWIFQLPELDHRTLPNLGYFLVGRHTGLLLYAPFAAVALALFLVHGRRSGARWVLLATLGGVAAFFLLFIPFNWHGGGGFIGNRYFVNSVPGFLFLVTRIAPTASAALGWALGGLLTGPLLFTPFGAPVPQPTLQAHVRNFPFPYFPLELTLGSLVPGYRGTGSNGAWFLARKDVLLPKNEQMWIHGQERVELWVSSATPLVKPVFRVETDAADNQIELVLGDARRRLRFPSNVPPDDATVVTLDPSVPAPSFDDRRQPFYRYRMLVHSTRSHVRPYRWYTTKTEDFGYPVGAILVYLGTEAQLAEDQYHFAWTAGRPPAAMPAKSRVDVAGRIRNTSEHAWAARGPTRVSVSYHWLDAAGRPLVWEGARSLLPQDVPPQTGVPLDIEVQTPAEPGRYLLEIDLVREHVAWFSQKNPSTTVRFPVEVVAPAP